jgi:hypothetical protein
MCSVHATNLMQAFSYKFNNWLHATFCTSTSI